jgi:hypothetical protein
MSYNPDNQYRCAIIRGKAKSVIDDLLPVYAEILNTICPIETSKFPALFNQKLSKVIPMAEEKTLNNHRTEIVGKLFGMYYECEEKTFSSEHTNRLVEDEDQPAFFKDICFKIQFPNGMESTKTIKEKLSSNLKLRPCIYLVQFLKLCQEKDLKVSINDIGYYILNNLDVLQGKASPEIVINRLITDKNKGIKKEIPTYNKASSYSRQHIKELLNYMELANLVNIKGQDIELNSLERKSILAFENEDYSELLFDIYSYSFESAEDLKNIKLDFSEFMSRASFKDRNIFYTPVEAIVQTGMTIEGLDPTTSTEIGNLGEKLVFNYEKQLVQEWNPRYVGRVLSLGLTKGLGYDVQSVIREGSRSGQAIFIEVKSTRRATKPTDKNFDSVTLTRNEWLRAEQSLVDYFIYRVYFTKEGVFLFKLQDPVTESENETSQVFAEPINYRLDFTIPSDKFLKIE